ncbi:response regulator, partial [Vibrio parahaemolyticus]|uniref:ATP-binding response regulator n=1 Tax=Vibrio parahaemolyticus TaxID=670 RepID=UPI0020126C33
AKRSFEGSGLGLAICKNLVDLMQGQISFESEERKGTTFKVAIPLEEGQAQGTAEGELVTIERSDLAGRSILVVDDIRMNQVIVTQMLKKLDITPDLKANGKEALEAVKSKDYELIFMDCRMPEMDGYKLTHEVRQDPRMSKLFITLNTSLSGSFNEAMVQKVGCDRFIS